MSGKHFQCKYQGPYRIVRQVGPVDYIIATPDKRKKERTCHVNMLKPYIERKFQFTNKIHAVELSNSRLYNTDTQTTNQHECHCDGLSESQKTELNEVLIEFSDVFSDKPGKTNETKHEIKLNPGTRPIKLPPYRVSETKADIIKKESEDMLELGVIEPSSSAWSAPVVLIPKPDTTYRFCVDYRRHSGYSEPPIGVILCMNTVVLTVVMLVLITCSVSCIFVRYHYICIFYMFAQKSTQTPRFSTNYNNFDALCVYKRHCSVTFTQI